jgi:hypothetical protein
MSLVKNSCYFVDSQTERLYYDALGELLIKQPLSDAPYLLDPSQEGKAKPASVSFEYLTEADSVALFFLDKSSNHISFIQWPYPERDASAIEKELKARKSLGVDVEYVIANIKNLSIKDNTVRPCTIL